MDHSLRRCIELTDWTAKPPLIDMEEEEERRMLEAVFGSSSSEGEETGNPYSPSAVVQQDCEFDQEKGNRRWERVDTVRGLWMCREFLTPGQQSSLLSSIDKEGWFSDSTHNQAMRFGDLPEWARILSSLILESCYAYTESYSKRSEHGDMEDDCPFSMDLLWREPLFDQLIANVYQPGEGICAHVDLMRFEDGIAVISLQSSCVMHFSRVEDGQTTTFPATRVPVLLTPGSLVLMSGDARYLWKHEINRKPGFQVWEGTEITQQRRTSITLRKLCPHHPDSTAIV